MKFSGIHDFAYFNFLFREPPKALRAWAYPFCLIVHEYDCATAGIEKQRYRIKTMRSFLKNKIFMTPSIS